MSEPIAALLQFGVRLRFAALRHDAGVIETRALAGAAAFHTADVVLHEDRVVVEPTEAGRAQKRVTRK